MQKSINGWGIVVAVLMAILGLVVFFNPLQSILIVEIAIVVGVGIAAIFKLASYFTASQKNGWVLLGALVESGFAGYIIYLLVTSSKLEAVGLLTYILSFFLFIAAFMSGVARFTQRRLVKDMGGSTGWITFAGIMDFVMALMLALLPFVTTFTITAFIGWVVGIFLVIGAIGLFAESLTTY